MIPPPFYLKLKPNFRQMVHDPAELDRGGFQIRKPWTNGSFLGYPVVVSQKYL